VTGDGPLYLGYLIEGYKDQQLIEQCPTCETKTLLISCFGGSPMSGSNAFTGICLSCSTRHNLENIAGFIGRMQFVSQLRKTKPLYVATWEEIDGQIFDWGTGLKPARKMDLVTKMLYRPFSLQAVIDSQR
jgi:hypothetical protein